jgi:hypothetical protein
LLQNFEFAPNQMESDLMHGTTADQLLAKEGGAYINQQEIDPDTVHAVTPTHSVTANTLLPTDEGLLLNFEFDPNQMESDLTHGNTADQLLAKETGTYIKQQDVDPDTVHAITGTYSLSANNSMSDAEWYLQNFEFAPNQKESDLMHGTTAAQLLAKEGGAYIKQEDVDPDTVHAVTATHSVTANTSMSDAEWYLQNLEFAPNQMESDLLHGTTADQLLAKDDGAYIKQQDVDPDMVHAVTPTHSLSSRNKRSEQQST